MSEIEKMYENAEVKKQIPKICSNNELYCKGCEAHIEDAMPYCKNAEYPPFTAAKQLNLIKFLLDKYCDIRIRKNLEGDYYIKSFNDISCFSEDFEETLASFTNTHLQDLTEEEKQQVKGILE